MPLVTGQNDRVVELLEDLLEKLDAGLVVNQAAPVVNIAAQKAPVVNVDVPKNEHCKWTFIIQYKTVDGKQRPATITATPF